MAAPTLEQLATFLQKGTANDPPQEALDSGIGQLALDMATGVVADYTRGVGFHAGGPVGALPHVILLVAARLYANPEGLRVENVGITSTTWAVPGFTGFTIGELGVLHRYRRRAA